MGCAKTAIPDGAAPPYHPYPTPGLMPPGPPPKGAPAAKVNRPRDLCRRGPRLYLEMARDSTGRGRTPRHTIAQKDTPQLIVCAANEQIGRTRAAQSKACW